METSQRHVSKAAFRCVCATMVLEEIGSEIRPGVCVVLSPVCYRITRALPYHTCVILRVTRYYKLVIYTAP